MPQRPGVEPRHAGSDVLHAPGLRGVGGAAAAQAVKRRAATVEQPAYAGRVAGCDREAVGFVREAKAGVVVDGEPVIGDMPHARGQAIDRGLVAIGMVAAIPGRAVDAIFRHRAADRRAWPCHDRHAPIGRFIVAIVEVFQGHRRIGAEAEGQRWRDAPTLAGRQVPVNGP